MFLNSSTQILSTVPFGDWSLDVGMDPKRLLLLRSKRERFGNDVKTVPVVVHRIRVQLQRFLRLVRESESHRRMVEVVVAGGGCDLVGGVGGNGVQNDVVLNPIVDGVVA
ncbi:hypothetical protein Vadar_020113 [Vaccinium darrowii]|uniref:Uncharacterized protein n=1 Tax=Vaccinium darrowii TaxID=229202 RepID=A0ACB7X2C1_9ERIC|nr:hypothetical protein Vadar_020113 [Vaccinium darrowii]